MHHLHNLAKMDDILGIGLYFVGLVLLLGGFIDDLWGDFFGQAFFLYWIVGWVFRRNALRLRRFDLSARTAQTVLAVLCVLSVVLIPAAIYSVWVMHGPCNARWYEEEHRLPNQ